MARLAMYRDTLAARNDLYLPQLCAALVAAGNPTRADALARSRTNLTFRVW
jgi:hypothetical protein